MRTDMGAAARCALGLMLLALTGLMAGSARAAEADVAAGAAAEEAAAAARDWQHWHANADVTDMPLPCSAARATSSVTAWACHSLKYERWSRLAQDLAIPANICCRRS